MYEPTKFEILGQEIKVKYTKNLLQQNAWGRYTHNKKLIEIQTHNIDGTELDIDHMSQTLMHEMLHCALDYLGYDDLSMNEQFVDQLAQVLWQIEKTMK